MRLWGGDQVKREVGAPLCAQLPPVPLHRRAGGSALRRVGGKRCGGVGERGLGKPSNFPVKEKKIIRGERDCGELV